MRVYTGFLLILLGLVAWSPVRAAAPALSPAAQISMLTLSPGEELYSTFGHSALRVTDPALGLDKVYNYGTFDFGEAGFYVKFVRGKLDYRLSTAPFEHMYWEAQEQNRSLTEQVLALSTTQKQRLFAFLEWNALPENRNYRYDFFYDNCSTRIRDALQRTCGDTLQFHLKLDKNYTFRQLIDIYLEDKYFADFGMDIGQGMPSDKIATPFQAMFLPDFLMAGFGSATLANGQQKRSLVSETRFLYQSMPGAGKSSVIRPVLITSLVLLLVGGITFRDVKRKKTTIWLDVFLFGITSVLGLLLLFLWFGTDHSVTKNNWNLLWAFPGHWLLLGVGRRKKVLSWYWLGFGTLLFVLVLAMPWLPQEIDGELVPLILALGIRALYLHFRTRVAGVQSAKRIRV